MVSLPASWFLVVIRNGVEIHARNITTAEVAGIGDIEHVAVAVVVATQVALIAEPVEVPHGLVVHIFSPPDFAHEISSRSSRREEEAVGNSRLFT